MTKFALLLSYCGEPYGGWQKQPKDAAPLPSVQSVLEAALFRLTEEDCRCVASGRTDAGVNATGQVVHFQTEKDSLGEHNVLRALNTFLPPSIRVLAVKKVNEDFHAQRSAVKKQYSYYWILGKSVPAHLVHSATLLTMPANAPLDESEMQKATAALIGTHEFKAFQASGAKPEIKTVKTIFTAELSEVPFGVPGAIVESPLRMLRLRLVGDGFLKQMVRSIAGTLQWVGEGKLGAEVISAVLSQPERHKIGPTAPPEGLWLEKVWYPEAPF
jgi:tRNA pseudouridine38-40 synthase